MGVYWFLIHLLLVYTSNVHASFEDTRCQCVCNVGPKEIGGRMLTRRWVKVVEDVGCQCEQILGPENQLCPQCKCEYQVRNTTTMKVVVCTVVAVVAGLTLYMIILQLLEGRLGKRATGYDLPSFTGPASHTDPISSGSGEVTHRKASSSKAAVGGYARFDNGEGSTEEGTENANFQHPSTAEAASPGTSGRLEFTFQIEPSSKAAAPSGPSERPRSRSDTVTDVIDRARDQQKRWHGNIQVQRARVFDNHTLLN